MATKIQRATSVMEAIADKSLTVGERVQIADYFVDVFRRDLDELIGEGIDPNNTQKSGFFLLMVRKYIRHVAEQSAKGVATKIAEDGEIATAIGAASTFIGDEGTVE